MVMSRKILSKVSAYERWSLRSLYGVHKALFAGFFFSYPVHNAIFCPGKIEEIVP